LQLDDAGPDAPLPFTVPEQLPLGVGGILATAFRVWGKNIGALAALGVLAYLPMALLTLMVPAHTEWLKQVAQIYDAIANAFLTASVTEGVHKAMRGDRIRFQESIGVGIKELVPTFAISVVYGLGVLLGLVLLIIPGILLITRWAVAVPVLVTEQNGVFDSLSRSSELTRGHRGAVFGVLVLSFLILILFGGIRLALTYAGGQAFQAIGDAVDGFLMTPYAVILAVLYHRLRALKEAPDAGELAEVFR
jgi:hypothetical protein